MQMSEIHKTGLHSVGQHGEILLEMAQSTCSIHYEYKTIYENLVAASETALLNSDRMQKHSSRENLGGENHHIEQCSGIPSNTDEVSAIELYFHRECYQKFTYARALLKKRKLKMKKRGRATKRLEYLDEHQHQTTCYQEDYSQITT